MGKASMARAMRSSGTPPTPTSLETWSTAITTESPDGMRPASSFYQLPKAGRSTAATAAAILETSTRLISAPYPPAPVGG
jgi:hypothetical protein